MAGAADHRRAGSPHGRPRRPKKLPPDPADAVVASLIGQHRRSEGCAGAEPSGVFTDLRTVHQGGRAVLSYVETRADREIAWAVFLDGRVRIAVGCQQPPSAALIKVHLDQGHPVGARMWKAIPAQTEPNPGAAASIPQQQFHTQAISPGGPPCRTEHRLRTDAGLVRSMRATRKLGHARHLHRTHVRCARLGMGRCGGRSASRGRSSIRRWNAESLALHNACRRIADLHSAQRAHPARGRRGPLAPHRRRQQREAVEPGVEAHGHDVDLQLRRDQYTVRQEIRTPWPEVQRGAGGTAGPGRQLQQTRDPAEAAEAYRTEQLRWSQSAAALGDILFRLGNAVREGTDDVSATDRRAASAWGR